MTVLDDYDIKKINYSVDVLFLVICGALVCFMQAGSMLIEVGSVRNGNMIKVLSTNTIDACIGAFMYWMFGHAFAYGTGSKLIGWDVLLAKGNDMGHPDFSTRPYDGSGWAFFFLQFGFVITVLAIVSGSVAERVRHFTYFFNVTIISAFVYPVVVHWIWSDSGWASTALKEKERLFGVGAIDFAGCAVVHIVGGIYGFLGTFFLGPRIGRFDGHGKPLKVQIQSPTFVTAGALMLWFGWYGFNCGKVLGMEGALADVAGKSAATTTLAAGAGGLTCTLLAKIIEGNVDIFRTNNGILAGLVSITAGCAVVQVEAAVLIGIIGGIIQFLLSRALVKWHIDDVVDASPVHFFCGMWGIIAAGLFAETNNVSLMYDTESCGLFYGCGNGWNQLAANVVFMLAVIAWAGTMAFIFYGLTSYVRVLRVDANDECSGLHQTIEFVNGNVCFDSQANALKWSLLGRLFESYATPEDTWRKGEDQDDVFDIDKESVGSDIEDHADEFKM